jgi:L-fuculose-phosphate aldolase
VPYGAPGTAELADRLEPFVADHDVWLLANHGATACGSTLTLAHQRMESLEQAARIVLAARLLGHVTPLAPGQVAALLEARARGRRDDAPVQVEGE